MNELTQKTIASVEVAEMVDKPHKDLLRDIRRYSDQLAEGKIAPGDFFTESTYPDANNQDRPCYLVTKKGCEFIANKLTGVKGAIFTAKYINKFNDMQEVIQTMQVPQSLIALQGMITQMIRQEQDIQLARQQAQTATQQSQQALDTTQSIKDTIIGVYDNWREEVKHLVSSIQKGSNKTFQDTYNTLYDELEKRAKCDLSARVRNGRDRLQRQGEARTHIEAFGRLDVIEADVRLKEIFTTIVKQYTIKYS